MRLLVVALLIASSTAAPAAAELNMQGGCRIDLSDLFNPTWSKDCFVIGQVNPPERCEAPESECTLYASAEPEISACRASAFVRDPTGAAADCSETRLSTRVYAAPTQAAPTGVDDEACLPLGFRCPMSLDVVFNASLEQPESELIPRLAVDLDSDRHDTVLVIGGEGLGFQGETCTFDVGTDGGVERDCNQVNYAHAS